VASSRIEGTQASVTEVFDADLTGEPSRSADIREVQNYVIALRHGLDRLSDLPVSLRLIKEMPRPADGGGAGAGQDAR
jgi:Fic family protein